jgi:hypothetical protein
VPMVRVTGKMLLHCRHTRKRSAIHAIYFIPPACVAADCSAERRPRRFQPPEVDRVVAFKTLLVKRNFWWRCPG